ncbi:NINE protein [Comamonas sp. B-9]|uniref:NINE protein n=1 Tax=Comamonas sp. B-9 TaxID=1055192 RepID=UPI000395A3C4|nr:NINE protein [Comamonas sp. B-9]
MSHPITHAMPRSKSKTLATWLAFLGGPLGLHRFYLHGLGDMIGWMLPIPTALGLYGMERIASHGIDDQLSWVLVPLLGFTIAACALTAIVYGLMAPEKWNARHNPGLPEDALPGRTRWLTIFGIVASLLIGTTILMASLAYSFEHYFQYQIEEARKISQ